MVKINKKDLLASVVVFLVALPLCMGIALASGVPPARGIVTGIIGGIVTGLLAGAPLQVSGPAAGLTVLIYELVQQYGLEWLGVAVLGAGLLQYLAGKAGFGRIFQAVSPAVIKGMLAGIGVLILSSQFHVMVDDKPRGSGLDNLLSIPSAIQKGLIPSGDKVHHLAAIVGIFTLLVIIGWEKFRPTRLALVPAPLVAILCSTTLVAVMKWPIAFISVPKELSEFVALPDPSNLNAFSPSLLFSIVALAFIASAETLLCATACDALHDGERADYNKELKAQGIGNMCCGFLGALPMTGVIVRTSANIKAGGESRQSAVLHGVWLAAFALLIPGVLSYIPTSALAGILVYIGFKLVDVQAIKNLKAYSRWEVLVYAVTLVTIVVVDLLTGVIAGLALALLLTVISLANLDIQLDRVSETEVELRLVGAATFLSIPKLTAALESLERHKQVSIYLERLMFLDHACLKVIEDFHCFYERQGGKVELEWSELQRLSQNEKLRVAA